MGKKTTKYHRFTDIEISELAQAVEMKNAKYRKGSQKSFYLTQQGDKRTIFERSGLLDEQGKAKSVDDIRAEMGHLINWKMTMTKDKLLSDSYIRERWVKTKDNYVTMAKNIGADVLAQEIANMTMTEFRKQFRQGKLKHINEKYDEGNLAQIIEQIIGDNDIDLPPELKD